MSRRPPTRVARAHRPRRPRTSLVRRLVVSFLAPVLAVLLAVALLTYWWLAEALERSVEQRLSAVADVKEAALNAWIDHLYEDTVLVAGRPEVGEQALALLDGPAGSRERDEAYRRLSASLLQLADSRPSVSELLILSAEGGRVALSTRPEHEGDYRAYDRYYVEGKSGPYVQNVYPSPVDLRPTLTISAPLVGADGTVIGVLAAHHTLGYLDETTLGPAGLGGSGRVVLVDRHKIPVTGRSYGESTARRGLRSLAVDEVVEGRSGGGTYRDPEGVPVIGVYRWIRTRELGLVVEVDRAAALAPARVLGIVVTAAGLALVPILLGGIYLVSRRIASPILGLAESSLRVAGGDLGAKAKVASDDEIGVLAENFNEMVGQLEGLYDDMAEKIASLEANERERERLIAELEAKNAELERFTYTVSHDLKSPLVTIRGFVGLMERDLAAGDAERARADLPRVARAAETMGQLLEQLLELSRVGRLVGPSVRVELGSLADEAVRQLAGRNRDLGAEIVVRPGLPTVRGDRVRLREVLENLIDNALKFMGDQPAPRVEVGVRAEHGSEVVVYVRDNGIGIDPRFHEKVFGLFDRLNPDSDGTGIGLALVRRIVETHGGIVWVESDGERRGSCFCFTLPLPDTAEPTEDRPALPQPTRAARALRRERR